MVFAWSLMIVKYSTNPSSLMVAMLVYKVIITSFFKFRVERQVKFIANTFIRLMKVPCIFFKKIVGSKIGTTTKPPVCKYLALVIQFKHPVIAMNGRNKRVNRMNHQADTSSKPF